MAISIRGNRVSGAGVGISVPETANVNIDSNELENCETAIEVRSGPQADAVRAFVQAYEKGEVTEQDKQKHFDVLRRVGVPIDKLLSTGANIAQIASTLASCLS